MLLPTHDMEEAFQEPRKGGGQGNSVGGQRMKDQRQEPGKSEVDIEGTGGKSIRHRDGKSQSRTGNRKTQKKGNLD